MYQSYKGGGNPMPNPMESIISVFMLSLGANIGSVWGGLDRTDHPIVGKVLVTIISQLRAWSTFT